MPKLTDEEVGQLLRETFAEKEEILDQLPMATVRPARRRLTPLVAAAAVLAVLGGAVSSVGIAQQRGPQPAAEPTGAVRTAQVAGRHSVAAEISGVAIAELAKWERPAAGWPVVKVLDSPYRSAANPAGAGLGLGAFSAADRRVIESRAGVPIEWVKSRPTNCDQADGTPYVTVGSAAVEGGSTATIGMSMWRGCLDAQWLTYRLGRARMASKDSNGSDWQITGTVGPVAMS